MYHPEQAQSMQYLTAAPQSSTPSPGQPHQQVMAYGRNQTYINSNQKYINSNQPMHSNQPLDPNEDIQTRWLYPISAIPSGTASGGYYAICPTSAATIPNDPNFTEWSAGRRSSIPTNGQFATVFGDASAAVETSEQSLV